MNNSSKLLKNVIIDIFEILFISIAIVALAWVFLIEPLEVTGDSMSPMLHNKEQIVVEKVSMNFSELKHGDIIVFNSPENPKLLVVKRIIGLPEDEVSIKENEVYLNGERLDEEYIGKGIPTQTKNNIAEGAVIRIPKEQYFVLGDNRENSMDSRDFGLVGKEELVGKAVLVYYPFENLRVLENEEDY